MMNTSMTFRYIAFSALMVCFFITIGSRWPSDALAKQPTVVNKKINQWQYRQSTDPIDDSIRHVFYKRSTAASLIGGRLQNKVSLVLVCKEDYSAWSVLLPLRPHPRPASYILRIDGGDQDKDRIHSSDGRSVFLTVQ